MSKHPRSTQALFVWPQLRQAIIDSFIKLAPGHLVRNPVMFMTAVVALLTTVACFTGARALLGLNLQLTAWLWFTVLFANFAEALAEGRGKARADSLRSARSETQAKKIVSIEDRQSRSVGSTTLRSGDLVLVEAGDLVPGDGEVVDGIASVNESAITGESAPVIRESGGDRSGVTGGTQVVSDWIVVRISADPGETFLDRMIALVEGAARQRTPNEIALNVLLIGLSLIFLVVVATLPAWAAYSKIDLPVPLLVALLVCLIPTTIGGLLSAIGIAGMDRLVQSNVVAKSGRAVEAAGDVDVLLIDKTGTITFGNRHATALHALTGVAPGALAEAALYASLADTTPEGRSIVQLIESQSAVRVARDEVLRFVEFSATTRLSGADLKDGRVRKGAVDAVLADAGAKATEELQHVADGIARAGGTPLAVSRDGRALGVIALTDVVKPGIKVRFEELRRMGIRTVMITGDNKLTASTIAAEAGVDEFLAEATPEKKLELIRKYQAEGRLVAMCGDGSNDAPALAQADVGVAMNAGTPAAKDAGNLIDLDSDPTKLIEVVMVGKQMLISRGALTTFSIANDLAKYFAILPALFVTAFPGLQALNIMQLGTPASAVLSAIIFNAIIIIALIPLALRGVQYRAQGAAELLSRNLAIYGLGGIAVPFFGIKAIDLFVNALHLV
jgi:K+-transporting ATPase ATPase B chain